MKKSRFTDSQIIAVLKGRSEKRVMMLRSLPLI